MRGDYTTLYNTMEILPDFKYYAEKDSKILLNNKYRYNIIESIPWEFPALIHMMECNSDFSKQLLNGQKWNMITTIVPIGLGPWDSWEDSLKYAMKKYVHLQWDFEMLLDRIERWNGTAYKKMNLNSPYIWSGSNHGFGVGKFVSDGKYDPKAVSKQIGAAILLKSLGSESIYNN